MAKNMSSSPEPEPELQKVVTNSHTEWIRINDLIVGGYQRIVNPKMVARIAENFDPNHVRVIDVARRGGKNYIVDGQHRVLAMRQRGMGEQLVQCNVWESQSSKQEAHAFDVINTDRVAVTTFSKYNARLWAGNEIEVGVQAMLDELDIVLIQSQGRAHSWGTALQNANGSMPIWAIGTVCRYYALVPDLTRRVLTLIRAIWNGQLKATDGELISGMVNLLAAHENIDDERLGRVMAMCTPTMVLDDAFAAKGNRSYSSMAYVAMTLADRYNAKYPRGQITQFMARTYINAVRSYLRDRSRQGEQPAERDQETGQFQAVNPKSIHEPRGLIHNKIVPNQKRFRELEDHIEADAKSMRETEQ